MSSPVTFKSRRKRYAACGDVPDGYRNRYPLKVRIQNFKIESRCACVYKQAQPVLARDMPPRQIPFI